jgi:hypothetical protein
MHKVHRSYKYTVQRRDLVVVAVGICGCYLWLLLLWELAVIVASEGDSCVKKKESTTAEVKGRGSVQ